MFSLLDSRNSMPRLKYFFVFSLLNNFIVLVFTYSMFLLMCVCSGIGPQPSSASVTPGFCPVRKRTKAMGSYQRSSRKPPAPPLAQPAALNLPATRPHLKRRKARWQRSLYSWRPTLWVSAASRPPRRRRPWLLSRRPSPSASSSRSPSVPCRRSLGSSSTEPADHHSLTVWGARVSVVMVTTSSSKFF